MIALWYFINSSFCFCWCELLFCNVLGWTCTACCNSSHVLCEPCLPAGTFQSKWSKARTWPLCRNNKTIKWKLSLETTPSSCIWQFERSNRIHVITLKPYRKLKFPRFTTDNRRYQNITVSFLCDKEDGNTKIW